MFIDKGQVPGGQGQILKVKDKKICPHGRGLTGGLHHWLKITESSNLGFESVTNQNILGGQISMNDRWSLSVKIVHSERHVIYDLQLPAPLNSRELPQKICHFTKHHVFQHESVGTLLKHHSN